MLKDLIDERKKFFAAKRAEAKRNKPPTKTEQRKEMSAYLRNMDNWKPSQLKNLSFEFLKDKFDKVFKKVNTFVPMETEEVFVVPGEQVKS